MTIAPKIGGFYVCRNGDPVFIYGSHVIPYTVNGKHLGYPIVLGVFLETGEKWSWLASGRFSDVAGTPDTLDLVAERNAIDDTGN